MDETWIREFSYTCTEEEIYLCLKRSGQRKARPGAGWGCRPVSSCC